MKKKIIVMIFLPFLFLFLSHVCAETEEEFWDYVNEHYADDPFWDDYNEDDYDDSWVNPDDYWGGTLTVPTDNGFESIGYNDVFDSDGNFIYEYTGAGDKYENEAIIAEYFGGGGGGGDSSGSVLISWYHNALAALESAEREGLDMHTIWEIEKSLELCKGYIESYCKENSYSFEVSENQKYMQFVNAEGMPVAHAGDPVILATGDFIIDDCDLSLRGMKTSFSIERHYSTGNVVSSALSGFFGCGWAANLETRVIRSYSLEFSAAIAEWESYRARLYEYETEIAKYAEEDSSCEPVLDSVRALIDEAEKNILLLADRARENEAQRDLNSFVEYGLPSVYAQGAGLDTIIYVQDNGGMVVFEKNNDCFELTEPFRHCAIELSVCDSGGYCVSYPNIGEKRFYSEYGLPVRFVFRNGGTIEFYYDEQMRISSVLLDGERRLLFSWSGRNLVSACDERTKNTIFYGHDGKFLTEVIDAEGDCRSFSYNDDFLLSRQIKADGSFVSFDYSLIDGKFRTVRTTDEEGKSEFFSYNVPCRTTVYTDHDGVSVSFCYDAHARTVSESYADGEFIRYSYNDLGLLASRADSCGTTLFCYDEKKRLVEKKYPDGSCEKWEYGEFGLSSFTDKDGFEKKYFYDSSGKVSDVFIGTKKLLHIEYSGTEIYLEDCRENKTVFSYDKFGKLIGKKIFAKGMTVPSRMEEWNYDEKERLVAYTDALGEKTSISYSPHKVSIQRECGLKIEEEYSGRKLLLKRTETDTLTGETRILSYEYDKDKRCTGLSISGTDSQGKKIPAEKICAVDYTDAGRVSRYLEFSPFVSGAPVCASEFFYNEAGRLFVGDEKNFGLECEYSPAGRLMCFKKGDSDFYEFSYDDEFGFCKGFREKNGSLSSFMDTEFYPDGLVKSMRDRNGVESVFEYDECGNLVRIHSSERTVRRFYDKMDRIIMETVSDSCGNEVLKTEWEYSPGKVTCIFGEKYAESYLLNAFGETVAFIDGCGNKTLFIRDLLGRVRTVRDSYGEETSFSYNGRNQILSETFADKTFLRYEYDAKSRCIAASDSSGLLWKKSYYENGLLKTFSTRPFRTTLSYSYDEYGNISSFGVAGSSPMTWERSKDGKKCRVNDFLGNKQEFIYDGYGRILSHKNTNGDESVFSYDKMGRVSSLTDFSGAEISYDYGNDFVSVRHADGNGSSCKYDCVGNIVSAKSDSENLFFSYDKAGLLISQSDGTEFGTIYFSYDKAKNLIQVRSQERTISYIRGKRGEILEIKDYLSLDSSRAVSKISFSYDSVGREIKRTHDSGEYVRTVYDSCGKRILTVGYSASNSPVFVDGVVYNDDGELIYSLDSNFQVTSYRYDDYGRLESVGYPYSDALAEKMKNELGEAGLYCLDGSAVFERHNLGSENYAKLQNLCELIGYGASQLDVGGAVVRESFAYDANDNIIRKTNPFGSISYSYDSENRLVAWGKCGEATYDKNGNLVTKKTLYTHSFYEYNSMNRMKSARILNIIDNDSFVRTYKYDALGRRFYEYKGESGIIENTFLGFGMSVFMSRKFFSVGENSVSAYSKSGGPVKEFSYSGRYAFIGEDDAEARGTRQKGEYGDYAVYPTYGARGNLLEAFSSGNSFGSERHVLMTDGKGSVMTECGCTGVEHYSYDVYGSPLSQMPYFSFAGKHFDSKTGMYDFGFRDYLPNHSRFTSRDLVYAGKNLYSYCGANPVTLFDADGLYPMMVDEQYMHNMGHVLLGAAKYKYIKDVNGNTIDDSEYADLEGCVVTAIAESLSLFTGLSIPNSYINSQTKLFNGGNISWKAVKSDLGLIRSEKYHSPSNVITLKSSYDEYQKKVASVGKSLFASSQIEAAEKNAEDAIAHIGNIKSTLAEIDSVSAGFVVLAQVGYGRTSSGNAMLHFVTINTEIKTINGQEAVEIRATSQFDKAENVPSNKYRSAVGWLVEEGKTYVPITLINRIDTLAKGR